MPVCQHRSSHGACPEAVAGALGGTIEATLGQWREWAEQQRDFFVCGNPGITPGECEAVALRFSALNGKFSDEVRLER